MVDLPWARFFYYTASTVSHILSSEAVELASLRAQLRATQEALDLQLVRQRQAERTQC